MTGNQALTAAELAGLEAAQARGRARLRGIPAGPEAPIATSLVESPRPVLAGDRRTLREWACDCGARYRAARRGEGCGPCLERAGAEARAARAARIRTAAMLPAGEDFAHVTLDHKRLVEWVNPARAVAQVRPICGLDYDEAAGRWAFLVLLGGTGAGKTTLGTAVFRWLLDRALAGGEAGEDFARRMVWASAADLARARRESRLGDEPKALRAAREASVLLIDDLGQEPVGEHADLVALVSDRQRARQRTILTSGFSMGELAARYGDHFERRISERAHVVQLKRREALCRSM